MPRVHNSTLVMYHILWPSISPNYVYIFAQIPGITEGVKFESLGARYILVVEKDAVFTYLCGQRIWGPASTAIFLTSAFVKWPMGNRVFCKTD